jgi:hypothetical protein
MKILPTLSGCDPKGSPFLESKITYESHSPYIHRAQSTSQSGAKFRESII